MVLALNNNMTRSVATFFQLSAAITHALYLVTQRKLLHRVQNFMEHLVKLTEWNYRFGNR